MPSRNKHTKRHGGRGSRMARAGTKKRRGGSGAAPWVISNFGSPNQQYTNTFGPGALPNAQSGNLIPTRAGAPAVGPDNLPQGSTANSVSQQGGRRRRKKGGYWAAVIEQALVPFGLLGLQQTYGRRKRGGKRSRKSHK